MLLFDAVLDMLLAQILKDNIAGFQLLDPENALVECIGYREGMTTKLRVFDKLILLNVSEWKQSLRFRCNLEDLLEQQGAEFSEIILGYELIPAILYESLLFGGQVRLRWLDIGSIIHESYVVCHRFIIFLFDLYLALIDLCEVFILVFLVQRVGITLTCFDNFLRLCKEIRHLINDLSQVLALGAFR